MNRTAALPSPSGWFCVAFSADVPRGGVVSAVVAGEEVVVFRTERGEVAVVDAYCPHLGAHMGVGGTVRGETLRCPFHGFCFDTSGACVSTPYGPPPPPRARVRTRHVLEKDGAVLVFHHPDGGAPEWEVRDTDWSGWTPLLTHKWTLRGHPQETTENSVDLGHFGVAHGYRATALRSLEIAGPSLTASYAFERVTGRGRLAFTVRAEFTAHVSGLGHSLVELTLPQFGLRMRQMILPTCASDGQIDLRVAMSTKHVDGAGPLGKPLARSISRLAFPFFLGDLEQDIAIWSHKRYLHPPILAEGDGPIMKYRAWAAQFYERAAAPRHVTNDALHRT